MDRSYIKCFYHIEIVMIVTIKGWRKPWEVMSMSMTLMVMISSWVYTYPETHTTIYMKYVQPFTCQSYVKKSSLKIK